MHADKNPGRLLLLRFRTSGVQTESRVQLRQNGITNDRSNQVRTCGRRRNILRAMFCVIFRWRLFERKISTLL